MKSQQILSAVGLALIISGPACSAKFVQLGDEDAGVGATCDYNGIAHAVGTSFPASDGCNTCSCASDGMVQCTLMACQAGVGGSVSNGGAGSVSCLYNGVNYAIGVGFKSTDGCNSCSCTSMGVACTVMFCGGVGGASAAGGSTGATCLYNGFYYPVGNTIKAVDGCNTCNCAPDGSVACTEMGCAAGGSSGVGGSTGQTCTYGGVNYTVGASFKSTDGCNSCSCTSFGVACTDMSCVGVGGTSGAGGSTGATCLYNGSYYPVGYTIKASDGCNTCNCAPDGTVACTHQTCGGVGGATGVGGSTGVTCLYSGVNYPVGSVFKATDDCNSCSCTSSGQAICTRSVCQGTGGASGAGGSSGVTCGAIPAIMPDCGSQKAIMAYDSTGCPKGYVCPICPAPKIEMPTCTSGLAAVATYDANGCVNGYVCPSGCNTIDLIMPSCDGNLASEKYDASGCLAGYSCPTCPLVKLAVPDCGTTNAVPVYDATGCKIELVCPDCPTTTRPTLPCTNVISPHDTTTGCAISYTCY
jgi:hypothetical protein